MPKAAKIKVPQQRNLTPAEMDQLRVLKFKKDFVPSLDKYQNFKASRKTYRPFDIHEDVSRIYLAEYPKRILHLIKAFLNMNLNIPAGLVSEDFQEHAKEVLGKHFPRLRCSSMRAVFEGRIPGVPRINRNEKPFRQQWIKQFLILCDLVDTIVVDYLESLEESVDLLDGKSKAGEFRSSESV